MNAKARRVKLAGACTPTYTLHSNILIHTHTRVVAYTHTYIYSRRDCQAQGFLKFAFKKFFYYYRGRAAVAAGE